MDEHDTQQPGIEGRTTEVKLAEFFTALWDIFCDGATIDGADLQVVLEQSGLCRWREITEEEAENGDCDYAAGDTVLDLNKDGREIVKLVRGA
jgi:hypothetical protein